MSKLSFRRFVHSRRRMLTLSLTFICFLFIWFYDKWPFVRSAVRINVQSKNSSELIDWEDYEYYHLDSGRNGPGEKGTAFQLPTDKKTESKKQLLYKKNGFNALVSDYIALNRSVPDVRATGCHGKRYRAGLPLTSVVIPFHNEHFSVLLRTVYSIVNRTPKKLLKEILLTDDFSTNPELKDDLDNYISGHWPNLVSVIRAAKREGLIRARILGAKKATGDVLVFLDSHSECNYNWLPPLLDPIVVNYRTVVCPFVDVIEQSDFKYKIQDNGARGSWDWQFYYKRLPLLPEDRLYPDRPFQSPVMAGGYFAISAKWFWELGGYDEGLDVWGGEQYELSFKVWMCGGEIIDAPCSHVGHIYRKFSPFSNAGSGDYVSRNYARVAEVWMDEYKEYLYNRRPLLRKINPGDLSKQKAKRKELNCKSFKWYMENVAFDQPKKYPLVDEPDLFVGRLENPTSSLCIYAKQSENRLLLLDCQSTAVNGQMQNYFLYTSRKEIKLKAVDLCFDVPKSVDGTAVILYSCHNMGGNQVWNYNKKTGLLHHQISGMCLEADYSRKELIVHPCSAVRSSQKWLFKKA